MNWQHFFDLLHKELAGGVLASQLKASTVLEGVTSLGRVERL
jgi:hypothetical protein